MPLNILKNIFGSKKKNVNFDEQLVLSLRGSRIPNIKQLKYLRDYLNKGELRLIVIASFLLFIAGMFLSIRFYTKHLELIPTTGGKYVEAVVGTPKYINPLYSSINEVDSDITSLVYSSLFKYSATGKLESDLVEKFDISADGKIYTLKIKNGVMWHNKTLLTANDVLFTFNAIKDSSYKSPLRLSLQGVQAEVVDDFAIKFQLKEPYSGFRDLLTFGILPSDLWSQISPNAVSLTELNLKPIGSGMYKIKSLIKDESGNLKALNLQLNEDYYAKKSLVEDLSLEFHASYEEAQAVLNNGTVDGLAYYENQFQADSAAKSFLNYNKIRTTQAKVVIFNTKSSLLKSLNVRQAVSSLIDKQSLVNEVAPGSGVLNSPILPESEFYNDAYKKYQVNLSYAKSLIEKDGWKLVDVTAQDVARADELIATGDSKKKTAGESYKILGAGKWYYKDNNYLIVKITAVENDENHKIIENLSKSFGYLPIKVVSEFVPVDKIQNDVIKTRDYEMLLTGMMLSADPDPYLYWHSSQIGTDGMNLSNFENKEADKLLEEGRMTPDINRRKIVYNKFLNVFAENEPAVFLYTTAYEYVQNKKLKNNNLVIIYNPSDRFADIADWYINVGKRFKW